MIKDGEVVGHAPATKIFQFLRRDVNKAFVEVTGTKVNGDWKFHAYSQSAFIHRMKDCRLVLFTLQDTLSLHSHHCPIKWVEFRFGGGVSLLEQVIDSIIYYVQGIGNCGINPSHPCPNFFSIFS